LDLEWASWVLVDVHGAVSTGSTMHEPVSGWRPRPAEVRDAGSGHPPDRWPGWEDRGGWASAAGGRLGALAV